MFNILHIFLQRAGNMLKNTLQFASRDARRCFLKLPFIFDQLCLIHFQSLFPCSDFHGRFKHYYSVKSESSDFLRFQYITENLFPADILNTSS